MQRSIAIIYTDNRVKNRNCNRLKFNAPGTIDQEISQRMEKKKKRKEERDGMKLEYERHELRY